MWPKAQDGPAENWWRSGLEAKSGMALLWKRDPAHGLLLGANKTWAANLSSILGRRPVQLASFIDHHPTVARVDQSIKIIHPHLPCNPRTFCPISRSHQTRAWEKESRSKRWWSGGGGTAREPSHRWVLPPEGERTAIEWLHGGAHRWLLERTWRRWAPTSGAKRRQRSGALPKAPHLWQWWIRRWRPRWSPEPLQATATAVGALSGAPSSTTSTGPTTTAMVSAPSLHLGLWFGFVFDLLLDSIRTKNENLSF
jgi:hypothetical protein